MCEFMLDSKLIKKYFKSGLWNKILLAAFLVFMIVGAVVGYFLHNNNVYAQQPKEGKFDFEIKGGVWYEYDQHVRSCYLDGIESFELGNTNYKIEERDKYEKRLDDITANEDELKKIKIVPKAGVEIDSIWVKNGSDRNLSQEVRIKPNENDKYTFDISPCVSSRYLDKKWDQKIIISINIRKVVPGKMTFEFYSGTMNGNPQSRFKLKDKFKSFNLGGTEHEFDKADEQWDTYIEFSKVKTNTDDLRKFKINPKDNLDIDVNIVVENNNYNSDDKNSQKYVTIEPNEDDKYTFDVSECVKIKDFIDSSGGTLKIYVNINEYKTVTLNEKEDLADRVKSISFRRYDGYNSAGVTETVTDTNQYGSYRVLTGTKLYIAFELKDEYKNGTVTCGVVEVVDKKEQKEEQAETTDSNEGEGGTKYQCLLENIQADKTVDVDIQVYQQTTVKLGKINGHSDKEKIKIEKGLRDFVQEIDVNCLRWITNNNGKNFMATLFKEDAKINVTLGRKEGDGEEQRTNRFRIYEAMYREFTVSSLSIFYGDEKVGEDIKPTTVTTENNEEETYFDVKIGTKAPSEIRVNLEGAGYGDITVFNYENSNFDTKDEGVFNDGVGGCKAYKGYDVIKVDGKWKVVQGHVDVILNGDYTVLRNSSATYTDKKNTLTSPIYVKDKDNNWSCSTGTGDMGQRLMVTFETLSPVDDGKISLMVVGEGTVFEVTFGADPKTTTFKTDAAVESITFDGRQTDKIEENEKSFFTTNASYVKNSTTSSNYSVEIKFVDGYTLNHFTNDGTDDVSQIMSFIMDKEGYTATVSDVEESRVEEGGKEHYVCKLNMSISDSFNSINKTNRLRKVEANLNLVFRNYTVKFVKEGASKYDDSVFWISKYTGSQEVDDSYETKKDYLKFSASATSFDFNLTLGKNYIDCIDGLGYTSSDSNVTVKPVGATDTDKSGTPATVNTTDGTATKKLTLAIEEGKTPANNITITIKNLKPNTIYVPATIERDSVLEKYGIEATATISSAPPANPIQTPTSKTIDGKVYYSRVAIGDNLRYDLKGGSVFKNWAKDQPLGVLFTNVFFDADHKLAGVDKGKGAYVDIKDLDTDETEWVTVGTEKFRVVKETYLKGPDEIHPKVNFKLNSRYKEFLDIIKVVKNDDDSWGTGEPLGWQDDVDEIIATATFETHPFIDTKIEKYFALKSHTDADLRDVLSEMIVQKEDGTSTEGLTLNSNISRTEVDAFPEEKYKILGVNFSGTRLAADQTGKDNSYDYSYRLLNIKFPRYSAQVNIAGENMATMGITSGFLVDSWSTVTEGEGENKKSFLSASYNYNSTIAFTVQAGPNYTISDIENEIKIFNTKQENGIDGTEGKVSYTYTEYQNEKNETALEIIVNNVKSNLYIYIDFGPKHKTITHTKIEGANSYRIEETGVKTDGKEEYRCKEMILGRNTVPDGSPYYFMVEAQTGYNIESLKISSTDTEAGLEEITSKASIIYDKGKERSSKIRVYKIESVKKNQTISGTIVKDQCSVTFKLDKNYPEALSYKYEGQVLNQSKGINVDYGENIEFSTQIEEKYNRSNYKIMLYEKGSEENGRELNLVNGVYNISNIVSDKDVRVEGIEINKYSINLVKNDAAEYLNSNQDEIYGVQTVEYNGNYEFTLKANTGYSIGESTQVICTSEDGTKKTLNPDKSGKYKLSNVKGDFTINIMNVDDIYYTVTFIPVEGVTYVNDKDAVVTGSFQIKHGSNFEFGVNVDDAYDDSKAGMYIVINDGKSQNLRSQILYSGRYTINNITEDAEIKVGNIRKNTYTVTLNKVEGMDFYNDSNKIISGDNTVSHGDSLSFKVNLYPAYADSKVKIMLGTQELSADESGFYTVKNVIENKIVTVNGVEETVESKFTNTINNLPDNVNSLSDVDDVISASRVYESLTDEQKARVGNIDKLKRLQEQVKKYHHVSNGITIEGVDWNIKLFAIPIDNSMEVYTRLYKKLNSEYILSLYNVYLWDTIQDVKYTLPEGQSAVISLPTPEMTYFERPTGIHEKDNGKLDYLSLILGNDQVTFTTDSFSPMGVVANRTSTPGRSSLLDTWDANVQAIKDYALSNANSGNSKNENSASSSEYVSDNDSSEDNDGNTGNINDKFKSRNNPVTPRGSAIRLLLVLLILILLSIIIIIIIENMKKIKEDKDGKK